MEVLQTTLTPNISGNDNFCKNEMPNFHNRFELLMLLSWIHEDARHTS
jgi:hypothetical protein